MSSASVLGALGGSALARSAQNEMLSWLPPDSAERDIDPASAAAAPHIQHSTEPRSAMFTTYAEPHPLAFTRDEAGELLETFRAASARIRGQVGQADAYEPHDWNADLPYRQRITDVIAAANRCWWQLDIETLAGRLLHYRAGTRHGEHIDMHPGSMQRKVSLTIQLSDSEDYCGGDLQLRCWGKVRTMPRLLGSAIVWPAWIPHKVTTVTAGERWALVLWAWGPPVR